MSLKEYWMIGKILCFVFNFFFKMTSFFIFEYWDGNILDWSGFHNVICQTETWIMKSTGFNNFFLLIYFLHDDIISKIDSRKIEYQSNSKIFVWDYDNFIENKLKQIIKNNSKSTKILKDKFEKNKS
jgi:hypothetical protein